MSLSSTLCTVENWMEHLQSNQLDSRKLDISVPKGPVVIYGPRGCGATELAKAILSCWKVPFTRLVSIGNADENTVIWDSSMNIMQVCDEIYEKGRAILIDDLDEDFYRNSHFVKMMTCELNSNDDPLMRMVIISQRPRFFLQSSTKQIFVHPESTRSSQRSIFDRYIKDVEDFEVFSSVCYRIDPHTFFAISKTERGTSCINLKSKVFTDDSEILTVDPTVYIRSKQISEFKSIPGPLSFSIVGPAEYEKENLARKILNVLGLPFFTVVAAGCRKGREEGEIELNNGDSILEISRGRNLIICDMDPQFYEYSSFKTMMFNRTYLQVAIVLSRSPLSMVVSKQARYTIFSAPQTIYDCRFFHKFIDSNYSFKSFRKICKSMDRTMFFCFDYWTGELCWISNPIHREKEVDQQETDTRKANKTKDDLVREELKKIRIACDVVENMLKN